jgi:hypothetical protein
MDRKIPPPSAPLCLERRHPSSQKGGTLVAADVVDLDMHSERMRDVDSYRPAQCLNCQGCSLHVHDYPWRQLRGVAEVPGVLVVRFICASCDATWRILPRCVARHLWRVWQTVETVLGMRDKPKGHGRVGERTARRWRHRLRSSAGQLAVALRGSAESAVASAARGVGTTATRLELADAIGGGLARVAALVHEAAAGIRVM